MKLINLELKLKFLTKTFNPPINLLFNSKIFLSWQSYLEYKLLGVPTPISDWVKMELEMINLELVFELINFNWPNEIDWNWHNGIDPMSDIDA